jgi:hypothetical protein
VLLIGQTPKSVKVPIHVQYESGTRVRLGELDSGVRLGCIYTVYIYCIYIYTVYIYILYIYIYTVYIYIVGQSPARGTPHTDEFDSAGLASQTRTCVGT